jgi:hypothetical protein
MNTTLQLTGENTAGFKRPRRQGHCESFNHASRTSRAGTPPRSCSTSVSRRPSRPSGAGNRDRHTPHPRHHLRGGLVRTTQGRRGRAGRSHRRCPRTVRRRLRRQAPLRRAGKVVVGFGKMGVSAVEGRRERRPRLPKRRLGLLRGVRQGRHLRRQDARSAQRHLQRRPLSLRHAAPARHVRLGGHPEWGPPGSHRGSRLRPAHGAAAASTGRSAWASIVSGAKSAASRPAIGFGSGAQFLQEHARLRRHRFARRRGLDAAERSSSSPRRSQRRPRRSPSGR